MSTRGVTHPPDNPYAQVAAYSSAPRRGFASVPASVGCPSRAGAFPAIGETCDNINEAISTKFSGTSFRWPHQDCSLLLREVRTLQGRQALALCEVLQNVVWSRLDLVTCTYSRQLPAQLSACSAYVQGKRRRLACLGQPRPEVAPQEVLDPLHLHKVQVSHERVVRRVRPILLHQLLL